MKRFWKKTEGFTLVELIVVIAILGILAGVGTVGYSGYIAKANKAADEVLLRNLNTAFAAACVENGEDNTEVSAGDITIGDDKTVAKADIVISDPSAKESDIQDAFDKYYEGGEFKVYTALTYADGVFEGVANGNGNNPYANLFNTIKEKYSEEIAEAINTNLGKIGTDTLFDQMNGAMDMASEIRLHTLTGAPFLEAYYNYLGFDPSDYEDDEAAQAAWDTKLAALGVDDATASTHAIALYAAQNSTNLATSDLSKWLGSSKTTDDLKDNANANTLAETAAIYGLYLSYNKGIGKELEGNTLEVMTDALTDNNFANWVNTDANAQTELEAYKTYMNFINEAVKDENAKNSILANGFDNSELENLVKDLMGN